MGCGSSTQTAPHSTGRRHAETVNDNKGINGDSSRPHNKQMVPQQEVFTPPPAAPEYSPPNQSRESEKSKSHDNSLPKSQENESVQPSPKVADPIKVKPSHSEHPPLPEDNASGHSSVVIHDDMKDKDKTGEEPKNTLPEAEVGDGQLGLTEQDEINKILSSLNDGELFCDGDFPAEPESIYYSQSPQDYTWLRPKDLVPEGKQPRLLVDGVSRDDIKQGGLGDCWFLSSCAAVSQQEKFMRKIIPDQPLCGPGYRGLVRFCFWRFGSWVDVYVDDRLPTQYNQLVFSKCDDPTEFWVALLEKAYAKLHGSFEAIEGGQTMDALVDLTGGLAERYEIIDTDPNMYHHVMRAHRAGAFIACSKKGNWKDATKADNNGLVSGHAYTITKVMKINHEMGSDKLLRIRNPWGNEIEWKGSWSDHDSNWKWVDKQTKKTMGLEAKDDGEFWMNYKDFCRHFQEVTICTIGPDFDGDGTSDKGHMQSLEGSWVNNKTAGGCRNDIDSFARNPQYSISLHEADDFDPATDDPEDEGKCSVVIALMQEHRRSKRHLGVKALQVAFLLYKTDDPNSRLPPKHFRYNYDAGKSGTYINLREVSGRFELEPGHYIIIPSTFEPNEPGSFKLRVFAQKKFTFNGPL